MYSSHDPLEEGVAPFGYSWIKTCSRFPKTLRSVPRPSSPPGAKASTECPSVVQFFAPSRSIARCAMQPRWSHTLNHRKLERDLRLTHHAQEPSIGFLLRNPSKKPPLGTAIFLSSTQRNIPTNFYSMPVSYSCNIHGHHNRNHRIIIPLNTRIFGQL